MGTSDCPENLSCNLSTGMCSGSTTTTTLAQGGVCGNGVVEPPESCDARGAAWTIGEYCDAGCNELSCGDTDNNGAISASDALFGLRVAVGLASCTKCVCDVDGTGSTTAGNALQLLRIAVGLSSGTACPACPN